MGRLVAAFHWPPSEIDNMTIDDLDWWYERFREQYPE